MKPFFTLALLLISCTLPNAPAQQELQQNILAISDVTIIDATGAPAKPNMNISNTKKISAVFVDGRLFPRASLDKMLTDAERAANRN